MRLAVLFVVGSAAWAQGPPEPRLHSTAQEVLLDLVVRDGKQRLVRDLTQDRVEVYEDGVRQSLKSFALVEAKDNAVAPAESAQQEAHNGAPLDPQRQINLITLVFDRLDVDAKRLSRQAVEDFLAKPLPGNTYVAVLVLDNRLNAIQEYTADRDVLKKAVERATAGLYSQYVHDSEAVLEKVERMAAAPAGTEAQSKGQKVLIETLLFELRATRYQQGRRQIEALMTLAREQRRVPGRKTVLYFSEGFTVPFDLQNLFENLIGVANRNNVAFYTLDVRGLQTTETLTPQEALNRIIASTDTDIDFPKSRSMNLEQTQMNLAKLADSTGGFLIANTNDLRTHMHRVVEQVRCHYELSWTPTSDNYDGHFRKIEVRLLRPGLKVQTRSGYYALPMLAGEQLLSYEMALLNALDARPSPHSVPYSTQVNRFGYRAGEAACSLQFAIPLSGFETVMKPGEKAPRVHLSWMAMVKDARGQVVRKLSRDLPLMLSATAPPGDLVQTETFDLAPGNYTVETAVLDRQAMKAGAKRAVLFIPAASGLRLSDINLVKRVDSLNGAPNLFDPLEFPGGRIVPSLASAVHAGAGSRVGLYFIIYPSAPEKPAVSIELFSDGRRLAADSPALGTATGTDAIPWLAWIPADHLNPGNYEVRVTVRQGSSSAVERTAFDVVE